MLFLTRYLTEELFFYSILIWSLHWRGDFIVYHRLLNFVPWILQLYCVSQIFLLLMTPSSILVCIDGAIVGTKEPSGIFLRQSVGKCLYQMRMFFVISNDFDWFGKLCIEQWRSTGFSGDLCTFPPTPSTACFCCNINGFTRFPIKNVQHFLG